MIRRPLPDSEHRREERLQRWVGRVVIGLIVLTALLGLALYLIG